MAALLPSLGSILAHSVIAIACALLAAALLAPIAARTTLAALLVLALPVIAAATGAYLAAGVSAAAVIIVSACVGTLLFANGAVLFVSPRLESGEPLEVRTSLSTLVLPLGVILVLAGFTIYSTSANIAALLVMGVVTLDLFRAEAPAPVAPGRGTLLLAPLALIPAALLAFNAHQITVIGTETNWLLQPEAYFVALLSPGILIPLVRHTTTRAAAGDIDAAIGTNIAFATLLVAILLPVLFGVDYALARWEADYARVANLPGISWRLDAPLIVVTGFALLGLRFGLLRPDRWLALLFLLLYGAYVMASTGLRLG